MFRDRKESDRKIKSYRRRLRINAASEGFHGAIVGLLLAGILYRNFNDYIDTNNSEKEINIALFNLFCLCGLIGALAGALVGICKTDANLDKAIIEIPFSPPTPTETCTVGLVAGFCSPT